MKTAGTKISSLVFIMTALLFSTAFSAKTLQKSFPLGPGGELQITGERCHIILEGSSRSDVHLQAECEKDIEEHYKLSFEQSEQSLEIVVEAIIRKECRSRFFGLFKSTREYFGLKSSEYLTFTISVPQDFNPYIKDSRGKVEIRSISGRVEVNNSRGPITVEGISGPVTAHNSRGDIVLSKINGALEAKNSRGSINVTDVSGDCSLANSRSQIKVENLTGAIEVHNSRGNIKVAGVEGRIKASNSRGHIKVEFYTTPAEDCQLSTSRGNIELYLPRETGANISAKAHRGKTASDFPLLLASESGEENLEGRIADSGPRIKLTTSRGDIRISATD